VEHETDHHGQQPEDQGALTRDELMAQAQAFAGEIMRWKIWYVKGYEPGPIQASLSESEAIQALSQVLVELLDGSLMSRVRARPDFALMASYLGYTLPESIPETDKDSTAPKRIEAELEQQDDIAFLRRHGLAFPDDETPPPQL
jgi:hypothetical protein